MHTEHLDRALAEEFAGHGEAIHRLKISDPTFKSLMERNHAIWLEVHRIESGEAAASDDYLESLKKQRLVVLDEIAVAIRKAEA
ncbi:MAG: DUF465 domain-containing protein [Hyphomonadaceae bacterium]|jgi:uncharacterized protein YdcH (DUF465 family)|nr:DUF465 domain-containing protein [Hyphomonadaceae bacterium]